MEFNTKKAMVDFLKASFDSVKDIKLTDELAKYLGEIKETPKEKFAELVEMVQANLKPVAENSSIKKGKKKSEQVEDKAAEAEVASEPEAKKAKKGLKKAEKAEKPAPPAKPEAEDEKAKVLLAKQFPESITNELGTFKVDLTITNIEQLKAAIDAGNDVVCAVWWTKRHLKQFNYDYEGFLSKENRPKEFPNDLDLQQIIFIPESGDYFATVSLYTQNIWPYAAGTLKVVDGMRFTKGAEFNIYIKE